MVGLWGFPGVICSWGIAVLAACHGCELLWDCQAWPVWSLGACRGWEPTETVGLFQDASAAAAP